MWGIADARPEEAQFGTARPQSRHENDRASHRTEAHRVPPQGWEQG